VSRRIFRPKREEVAGGWRRLHDEELHYLYSSPDIIGMIKSRRMRWEGYVACIGEMRHVFETLVGKTERKSLGRRRRKWEDYVTNDPREMGCIRWLRIESSGRLL
jgi:hypothetical protein